MSRPFLVFAGFFVGLFLALFMDNEGNKIEQEKIFKKLLSAEDQTTLTKFRKDVNELQKDDIVVMDDGTWVVTKQSGSDLELEGPGPKSNAKIGRREYFIGRHVVDDVEVMRKFKRIVKRGEPDYKQLMAAYLFD